MQWDELIGAFRELGGVAENVRLDWGPRGRGIFVCDPAQPAKLHAPENLLFPVADIEIRNGQLVLKAASKVGERERLFFEAYERHFGWGGGGFEESWNLQKQWSELPADVTGFLTAMGGLRRSAQTLSAAIDGALPRTIRARALVYVRRRSQAHSDRRPHQLFQLYEWLHDCRRSWRGGSICG